MPSLFAIYEASPVAGVIIPVALMLFFGFAVTRLTKLVRLPNVTAYILTGILLGPNVFNLVPQSLIDGMDFLSDIALAFIAFGTGEFFRLSVIRQNGGKVVVITLFEALMASTVVFVVTYLFLHIDFALSVVLAALASATAPASTMMTIRQTGAKGDFVNTLLQVVAFDDIVALMAYSIAISLAVSQLADGAFRPGDIIRPILINLGVILLGCFFGILMKVLMPKRRSADNRLIISVATLFAFCGICALLDVSPLLGCMSMGTVYINISEDEKLFRQLGYFSPPILLLFFVRSGMNFRFDVLLSASSFGPTSLLLLGTVYFIARIGGKYLGAFIGCAATKKPKTVCSNLGLALIPQAGVAIGLSALGARTLGGEMGRALETVILASSILYELIGPGAAKLALYRSHSYETGAGAKDPVPAPAEGDKAKTPVEELIARIEEIRKTMPEHSVTEENEQAFTEAAEEQYQMHYRPGPLMFFGRNRR